jgi:general secretion pathway protein I
VYEVTFSCEITGPDLKTPERVEQRFHLLRPTWVKGDERDKLRLAARERIEKIITKAK